MTGWMPGLVWTRSTTGQPGSSVDTIGGHCLMSSVMETGQG